MMFINQQFLHDPSYIWKNYFNERMRIFLALLKKFSSLKYEVHIYSFHLCLSPTLSYVYLSICPMSISQSDGQHLKAIIEIRDFSIGVERLYFIRLVGTIWCHFFLSGKRNTSVIIRINRLTEVNGILQLFLQHKLARVTWHLQQEEARVTFRQEVVRWVVLV